MVTKAENRKDVLPNIPAEYIREHMMMVLVPGSKVGRRAHIDMGDVSIIFRADLDDMGKPDKTVSLEPKDGRGIFTADEYKKLVDLCIRNRREQDAPIVASIDQVIGLPEGDDEPTDKILVITTKSQHFGASAILDPEVDQKIRSYKSFSNGYWILPSSIHEVLVIPADMIELEEAQIMVKGINRTEVPEEDRLSDNIFKLVDGKLEIVQ